MRVEWDGDVCFESEIVGGTQSCCRLYLLNVIVISLNRVLKSRHCQRPRVSDDGVTKLGSSVNNVQRIISP